MTMKVSAVITTHNRKDLLEKARISVQNQRYENIEIIVVNDASDDGTEEIIYQKYADLQSLNYNRCV